MAKLEIKVPMTDDWLMFREQLLEQGEKDWREYIKQQRPWKTSLHTKTNNYGRWNPRTATRITSAEYLKSILSNKPVLKVSEVAAILGVTPKTVYRMIERGTITTHLRIKPHLIRRASVEKLLLEKIVWQI